MVRLRPELLSGELTLAQFAADLHEVAEGAGRRPAYEDPARFFALTYPTHALRELAKDVAGRLAGESDKAVRQLELTYGGGKTHTLITLHHLFRDPPSLPDLPAVREFREHAGRELPRARIATLCFDKIDVEKGIEGVRGPGGERRTLRHPWSVLAFQLAGDDGLRVLHAEGKAEERETPPAEPLLVQLIAAPARRGRSTLILADEVLMYARTKVGLDEVWRARILDFFQHLIQAVTRVDRAAFTASLLATDPTKQRGEAGKQLIADLYDVFRRQKEEGVQPVAKEDVAEVLRRQFFLPEDLADRNRYRDQVIAVVRDLGRLDKQTKKAAKAEEERFLAAWPFHPDLTEVFYGRWTQLEGFQRTRGILRTLAIGLREAHRRDECPVIGPAALLGAPGRESASAALSELASVATTEEARGRRTEWKQLLEAELGKARAAQEERSVLAGRREVEQAVVAVFLHSQPRGKKAHTPELKRLIGSGAPDGIELDKGLARWRETSWFLDDEDDAGSGGALPKSWRLGNRPNLRQMHDEAVRQRVSAEAVEARVEEAVRKAKRLTEGAKAARAEVHLLPAGPADLPDDLRFRFAVLDARAASASGKPSALARRVLDETTGPDRPRVHRNAVVLAVPSRDGIEAVRTTARALLGWEDVRTVLARGHAVEAAQQVRLDRNLKESGKRLHELVRQAWSIVVTTDPADRPQAFRLPAQDGPLFAQIKNDERSRIQEAPVEPTALLPDGPHRLWGAEEPSRRVAELAEAFARHSRLPKLLRPEAVRETVLRAVEKGLLVARLGRPDGSVHTFWHEKVGPEAARSPDLEGVLPERAALSRLAEDLLRPEELPGLWSDGRVTLADLLAYFDGKHAVPVPREGYEDTLAVPECEPRALREAVSRAVEKGFVWLVNGPTSLWKEAPPEAAFAGAAELREPPEAIAVQKLLPDAVSEAWSGGTATGFGLHQALGQRRGEVLPWALVRDAVRQAVKTGWLQVADGRADCALDEAGQLRLERPAAPHPKPDGPTRPDPLPSGALLEVHHLQDLAEQAPELVAVAAGSGLRFRVRPELEGDPEAAVRAALDGRLRAISPDLGLGER